MLIQVLLQILRGTPPWVFALLAGLVVLGWLQSRPREVKPALLLLLPAALGVYSLTRVLASFGPEIPVLAAWAAGTAAALLLNRALRQPAGARWSEASGSFLVPGSWMPLVLMMAMFFARYALALCQIMVPELVQGAGFGASASFGLGMLSGTFLARALWIRAQRPASPLFNLA
jgi:hypothetical protein